MSKQKEIDEMIDIIVEELDNSYAFGLEVAGEKIYHKEIDEMIDIIVEELDNSYAFGLEVAGEKIYHIYRRKRKDACEKTAKKVRKETAKEILKMLVGHTLVDDGWTWTISADDVRFIAEKYGVEVDE